MGKHPISYSADVVLRDGSTVQLRTVRPDDEPRVAALLERLSSESLHSRFFRIPQIAVEARQLVHPKEGDEFELVGELAGRICAIASYHRNPQDPRRAEVAFAIADELQGRGIGTRLLEALAEVARERDFQFFDAYVLADNHRMMRVFHDSGFTIESALEAGVLHVVFSLAPTALYQQKTAERSEQAATASMKHFLEPRSIAVIGANRERGKIGSEVLHNIIASGFTGDIAAVHPSASLIQGVRAYASVGDIPGAIDLAVICVHAPQVIGVVKDCLSKGVKALVVISAGFGETGRVGRANEDELVGTIRRGGVRMVGPNCMGLINTDPRVRMNATFAPTMPPAGRVAMSTQSGALGLAILDYAQQLNIGFSTFVSVGNKADVSSNDLLQYWASDPNTDVILMYLESFGNPRKFSQIARRVGRRKAIIAVKAGRSTAGARAATSHTGALASSDAIVDALFRQAGVIRTSTLEELFDVAALLTHQPVPRGRRVAILTNAGGPGILAADACEAHGLELPALSDGTIAALRSFLPPAASVANPVDMIASASAAHYERALGILLQEDRVDSVLVIFIPPLVTKEDDVAQAVRSAVGGAAGKTVAAIFMSAKDAAPLLRPIPCFRFPESAAVALSKAADRGDWLKTTEGRLPHFDDLDSRTARRIVDDVLRRGGGWLTPLEAQTLLAAAGIQAAPGDVATSETSAVDVAGRIGYPVVMKAIGPAILHKTDVGGVVVDLRSETDVRSAWNNLTTRLGDRMAGSLIQEMAASGVDMLVGITQDETFGPVVACAMGGTLTELLQDSAFRLHPLTEEDAGTMIESLRGARLLRSYRGTPPADETALRECLLRVSALVDLCPEIQELDINPLRVFAKGARALDVRVRAATPQPRPVSRRVAY